MARGVASAVPLTLTPIVASGTLAPGDYDSWILLFSLLPWILTAQLGIQTGIVALASDAAGDDTEVALLSRSSLRITLATVAAGAVVVWGAVELLGLLGVLDGLTDAFHDSPATFVSIAAGALALAAANSQSSLLVGVGRAHTAALAAAAGALVVAVALVVWRTSGTGASTVTPGIVLVAGGTVSAAICRIHLGRFDTDPEHRIEQDRTYRRRLTTHMRAQAVWVVPGLLISGTDNFLVSAYDADALAPYSLALVVATLGTGLVAALAVPLVGFVARSVGPGGEHGPDFARTFEWIAMRMSIISIALTPVAAVGLVGLFAVQDRHVDTTVWCAILIVLCGHSVRLLTSPLAALSIGVGRQPALYSSPIAEAIVNLALSVSLGAAFGSIGVAIGTLAGALAAVAAQTRARRRSFDDLPVPRALWRRTAIFPAVGMTSVAAIACVVAASA